MVTAKSLPRGCQPVNIPENPLTYTGLGLRGEAFAREWLGDQADETPSGRPAAVCEVLATLREQITITRRLRPEHSDEIIALLERTVREYEAWAEARQ